MMIATAMLLYIAGQSVSTTAAPMEVRQIVRREHQFIGKHIAVCGNPGDDVPKRDYIVIFEPGQFDGVFVDRRTHTWRAGGRSCAQGVMRRRDGLSHEEAMKRNDVMLVYDTPNPQYIIRPK